MQQGIEHKTLILEVGGKVSENGVQQQNFKRAFSDQSRMVKRVCTEQASFLRTVTRQSADIADHMLSQDQAQKKIHDNVSKIDANVDALSRLEESLAGLVPPL